MAELFPYSRLPKDEWPERCSDASVLAGAAPVPIVAEELLRERIGGANVCDKRRALSWYKSQYPGVDFSREWRCAAGVGPHAAAPVHRSLVWASCAVRVGRRGNGRGHVVE